MLTNIIPAAYRKAVYAVYAVVGVILGAVQVAFSSSESGQPAWLTTSLAVFAFLGTALGATAAANTDRPDPGFDGVQDGDALDETEG